MSRPAPEAAALLALGLGLLVVAGCDSEQAQVPADAGSEPGLDAGGGAGGRGSDAASDAPPGEPGSDAGACGAGQTRCGKRCIDPITPDIQSLHKSIFKTSCGLSTSCHAGGSAKEGLRMATVSDVFDTAVRQPSRQRPAVAIIEPGDPGKSYLLNKLSGMDIAARGSTGIPATAMPPPPNGMLCEHKIRMIEQWIAQGAKR
ncbi:MAG: hypothetical protein MJD61_12030 [Proteobacteria bacterium]|nr:hypothetical protein [Pseudomonadota bacterium]